MTCVLFYYSLFLTEIKQNLSVSHPLDSSPTKGSQVILLFSCLSY